MEQFFASLPVLIVYKLFFILTVLKEPFYFNMFILKSDILVGNVVKSYKNFYVQSF